MNNVAVEQDASGVPTSVMPKGVEHSSVFSKIIEQLIVPTSVMPKGVEHHKAGWVFMARTAVPTSVMPKGVEH